MPPIRPNCAIIVAIVTHTETYSKQSDFNILSLDVKSASPKKEEPFLFNEKEDNKLKALISKESCISADINEKATIKAELKKVDPGLWRIIKLI
ncbi:MAG: hypothetical protein J0I84_02335 [Terrimonas sp.]|nr:hypothetical protein [Terrimonas sp.]OJY82546.1 MAG: hypothetical protein BGP13_25400 [Sphingobacteriales bacterium 40-81]